MQRRIGGPILLVVLSAAWLAGCGAETPTPAPLPPATLGPTAAARPAAVGTVPPLSALATPSALPPTAVAAMPPTSAGAPPPTAPLAAPPTAPAVTPAAAAPSATLAAPAAAAQPTQTPLATEAPVAPEQNPPGDISDTQAFVTYRSADGGYQVDVPEGWARTVTGGGATFVDKLNGVQVTLAAAPAAPTSASARATEVPALQRSARAVQLTGVRDVTLANGSAVVIEYTSNSDPNPVTGKQVRLENVSYLFFHNGQVATLHLWAPAGADNVDQWQRMATSFRWQ